MTHENKHLLEFLFAENLVETEMLVRVECKLCFVSGKNLLKLLL